MRRYGGMKYLSCAKCGAVFTDQQCTEISEAYGEMNDAAWTTAYRALQEKYDELYAEQAAVMARPTKPWYRRLFG